ncbi:hypothetical protein GPJ56_003430 [Histomonas meleagridis]|uniref:uncharacterized protein n=1 Tax=Histomonas meleagridis TaxID=135588 RepID=UPI00355A5D17|nr:hypothetical protein GPJ56_003430 [Histomonas meleagridis]KAH0799122.1 hypothetical protein GO595_007919 [Histomonas meleagridis]
MNNGNPQNLLTGIPPLPPQLSNPNFAQTLTHEENEINHSESKIQIHSRRHKRSQSSANAALIQQKDVGSFISSDLVPEQNQPLVNFNAMKATRRVRTVSNYKDNPDTANKRIVRPVHMSRKNSRSNVSENLLKKLPTKHRRHRRERKRDSINDLAEIIQKRSLRDKSKFLVPELIPSIPPPSICHDSEYLTDNYRVEVEFESDSDDSFITFPKNNQIEPFLDDDNPIDDFTDLVPPKGLYKKPFDDSNRLQLNSKLIDFLSSRPKKRKKSNGSDIEPKDKSSKHSANLTENKPRILQPLSRHTNRRLNPKILFNDFTSSDMDVLTKPYTVVYEDVYNSIDLNTYKSTNSTIQVKSPWFKFFSDSTDSKDSLPESYVPYLSYQDLLNQTVILDLSPSEAVENISESIFTMSHSVSSIDSTKRNYNIKIGPNTSRIPLSIGFYQYHPSQINILGSSQSELSKFQFISNLLYPLDHNNTDFDFILRASSLEQAPNIHEKLNLLFEIGAKSQLIEEIFPFSMIPIEDIPIFCGNLHVKGRKVPFTSSHLLASGILNTGDKQLQLSTKTLAASIDSTSFKVYNGEQTPSIFTTDSDIFTSLWVSLINDISQNKSVSLLSLYIFILSSHSPTLTENGQIIEAIISPFPILPIILLNHFEIGFKYPKMIFNIMASKKRIDFFMRTIINAEISLVPFSKLFKERTRYTTALMIMFISIAEDWLQTLITNIILNEVDNGIDLLTVIFSMFSIIDNKSFYFLRCLILMLAVNCGNRHPLIPFFRFLKITLRPFFDMTFGSTKKTHEKAFDDLEWVICEPKYAQTRTVMELAPFTRKIIQSVPKIDAADEDITTDAEELRKFMVKNVQYMLENLNEAREMDVTKHPVIFSYYQNMKFVLMDLLK